MFDFEYQPFYSKRAPVFGSRGMVATAQPLAAQAGLEILKKGGNAIDAAIATAACLTVVEPTSNGIGSDAFAIIYTGGKLYGLNASGTAPALISIDAVRRRGFTAMPAYGFEPVIVPGAPAAWAACSARFGKLSLAEVMEPAVDYAENGYPLSAGLAKYWRIAYRKFKGQFHQPMFEHWFRSFAPDGRPPAAGELWHSSAHADTLRKIAATKAEAFYKGDLADQIDRFSRENGGFIRKSDLETYRPQWVTPVSVNYRGYDVWELPPNGQGIVALMALNLLKQLDYPTVDRLANVHRQIEALKLAFSDGKKYITDPRAMTADVSWLLSDDYARRRSQLIGRTALDPLPGSLPKGGTVYLATADANGNMVSFIQSNYMGFGSGLVVPGTGIALQNRGHTFSLNPAAANALAPGKRTYHTIIPGFLTKDGQPVGPFGVMGGFMQPQGHLQVLTNMLDFHLHPQAALDAQRWQWIRGKEILVEPTFPQHIAQALARRGHDIHVAADSASFGRGQIIWRSDQTGVLVGGTESRADGVVAAW